MRVLQIINSLETGGAERLVVDLSVALARLGHGLSICVLKGGAGSFGDQLATAHIAVHRCGSGSIYSPGKISRLSSCVEDSGADLVHVHLAPALYWTVAALSLPSILRKRAGRPALVTTEHTTWTRRMARPWLRPVERALYRRVDSIVCPGRASAEAVAAWLAEPVSGFEIIPNGIDAARFGGAPSAPDILEFLHGRKGLVMAARFTAAKDHATLLRAMCLLPLDVAVVFAGDGETRGAVEALAGSLGLTEAGRVLFVGTRADMPAVYAACDAAVLSSHWEGFGMSVLEAMAAGLPVVASDLAGIRDAAGEAALYFPVGDEVRCAKAIARALGRLPEVQKLPDMPGQDQSSRRPSGSAGLSGASGVGEDVQGNSQGISQGTEAAVFDPVAAGKKRVQELSLETCAARYAALYARLCRREGR